VDAVFMSLERSARSAAAAAPSRHDQLKAKRHCLPAARTRHPRRMSWPRR